MVRDWDRTPSRRDPRLRREVRASRGILIRDIAAVEIEDCSEPVAVVIVDKSSKAFVKWEKSAIVGLHRYADCATNVVGGNEYLWGVRKLFERLCGGVLINCAAVVPHSQQYNYVIRFIPVRMMGSRQS